MTLDFHQSDASRPLTQFRKEGGDDINVNYIFWILLKILTAPLAQDVKKGASLSQVRGCPIVSGFSIS